MKFSFLKIVGLIIFILGLIYILSPVPSSVYDFKALPNSFKSDEPGDTIQVPNVTAYYSDFNRAGITSFYRQDFRSLYWFGQFLPPVILNYPPEDAYTDIRDQLLVTFIEEYSYPLKGSVFVGGYEPVVENNIHHSLHTFVGDHIQLHQKGRYYNSKAILRYYPAPIFVSLLVYLGIWVGSIVMFKLIKQVFKKRSS
jgi:hypothetical protein